MPNTVRHSLGRWLRRHSLTLVATLGGATGVALAVAKFAPSASPPAAIASAVNPGGATAEPARDTVQDTVQIVLILDTSSSMNGLINQARAHLWKMVDDMGKITRVVDGKTRGVKLEIALYEYGNDTLKAETGYIRQVSAFSSDLDSVSEKLEGLFTNGGSEFAGQAIQVAVNDLPWSKDPSALRFVFLAGNESFDQGPVAAAAAMKIAEGKDITVQLIHCGDQEPTWSAAALLARTDLTHIDQNKVAAHIPSPQDAEILRLGGQLNSTYVAYGAQGRASVARQAAADMSSAKMSEKVALERTQMKAKRAYKNENWDVVDAVEKDKDWLAKAKDADLPTEMQGKSIEEKQAFVAKKTAERAALKKQIAKLEAERAAFIAAEKAKTGQSDAPSLESEMLKSTKKAAAKKGYKF
jgi:hypothetical protein